MVTRRKLENPVFSFKGCSKIFFCRDFGRLSPLFEIMFCSQMAIGAARLRPPQVDYESFLADLARYSISASSDGSTQIPRGARSWRSAFKGSRTAGWGCAGGTGRATFMTRSIAVSAALVTSDWVERCPFTTAPFTDADQTGAPPVWCKRDSFSAGRLEAAILAAVAPRIECHIAVQ
jgi:hypothetical protein